MKACALAAAVIALLVLLAAWAAWRLAAVHRARSAAVAEVERLLGLPTEEVDTPTDETVHWLPPLGSVIGPFRSCPPISGCELCDRRRLT